MTAIAGRAVSSAAVEAVVPAQRRRAVRGRRADALRRPRRVQRRHRLRAAAVVARGSGPPAAHRSHPAGAGDHRGARRVRPAGRLRGARRRSPGSTSASCSTHLRGARRARRASTRPATTGCGSGTRCVAESVTQQLLGRERRRLHERCFETLVADRARRLRRARACTPTVPAASTRSSRSRGVGARAVPRSWRVVPGAAARVPGPRRVPRRPRACSPSRPRRRGGSTSSPRRSTHATNWRRASPPTAADRIDATRFVARLHHRAAPRRERRRRARRADRDRRRAARRRRPSACRGGGGAAADAAGDEAARRVGRTSDRSTAPRPATSASSCRRRSSGRARTAHVVRAQRCRSADAARGRRRGARARRRRAAQPGAQQHRSSCCRRTARRAGPCATLLRRTAAAIGFDKLGHLNVMWWDAVAAHADGDLGARPPLARGVGQLDTTRPAKASFQLGDRRARRRGRAGRRRPRRCSTTSPGDQLRDCDDRRRSAAAQPRRASGAATRARSVRAVLVADEPRRQLVRHRRRDRRSSSAALDARHPAAGDPRPLARRRRSPRTRAATMLAPHGRGPARPRRGSPRRRRHRAAATVADAADDCITRPVEGVDATRARPGAARRRRSAPTRSLEARRSLDALSRWPGWRRDRVEALLGRLEGSTARADRRPDRTRVRGRRADRRGAHQRSARRAPVHLAEDGGGARLEHPRQARAVEPHRDRRLVDPARASRRWLTSISGTSRSQHLRYGDDNTSSGRGSDE